MGKKDYYTVKQMSGSTTVFEAIKFDEDLNPLETYHITEINQHSMICTCPAGSRDKCRHRTMLRLFQAEERVGKGWFYQFDKNEWVPPIA